MMTSYFAKPGIQKNPLAVSISLYPPRWWGQGRRCRDLAPTKEMLKKGYAYDEYAALLESRNLDPATLYEQLKDSILCCWEKSGAPCHRYMAAWWFHLRLGIDPPPELD